MPQQQGGQIQDWSAAQYPGILGATPTTPIALDAQIAALINGGGLSDGDKLLRVSDFNSLLPAQSVTAVRTSGILDEIDYKPIVEVAPFTLMPSSRVFTKGNICYVSVIVRLLALATAPNVSFGIELCTGLPPCPLNGTTFEGENGLLIAMSRFGRATLTTTRIAADTMSLSAFKTGVAEVSSGGTLRLANLGSPMLGNATAAYTDFITISGHYPLSLTDAVP
jgi:hypothetical protein